MWDLKLYFYPSAGGLKKKTKKHWVQQFDYLTRYKRSLTRVTKSYLFIFLALGTTQISSYFTKHWTKILTHQTWNYPVTRFVSKPSRITLIQKITNTKHVYTITYQVRIIRRSCQWWQRNATEWSLHCYAAMRMPAWRISNQYIPAIAKTPTTRRKERLLRSWQQRSSHRATLDNDNSWYLLDDRTNVNK